MRSRIFSIMDTGKKKTGLSILCVALMLTVGTGLAFAANAATQNPPENIKGSTEVTPWIAGAFLPNPDVYAKYADFGITISEDGAKLLYNGQPVRLFADEGADAEAFYLDATGNVNLSVVRNTTGEITGMESITAQKAQEYQDAFFAEELGGSFPKEQDITKVQEGVQVGPNKKEDEDVSRLLKDRVSEKVLNTINSCDAGTWYVVVENEYQYIYYSGVPHNYAWQPEISQDSAMIQIFDIGKSTGTCTYVLLKVPAGLKLDVYYNTAKIKYEKVNIQ